MISFWLEVRTMLAYNHNKFRQAQGVNAYENIGAPARLSTRVAGKNTHTQGINNSRPRSSDDNQAIEATPEIDIATFSLRDVCVLYNVDFHQLYENGKYDRIQLWLSTRPGKKHMQHKKNAYQRDDHQEAEHTDQKLPSQRSHDAVRALLPRLVRSAPQKGQRERGVLEVPTSGVELLK